MGYSTIIYNKECYGHIILKFFYSQNLLFLVGLLFLKYRVSINNKTVLISSTLSLSHANLQTMTFTGAALSSELLTRYY